MKDKAFKKITADIIPKLIENNNDQIQARYALCRKNRKPPDNVVKMQVTKSKDLEAARGICSFTVT